LYKKVSIAQLSVKITAKIGVFKISCHNFKRHNTSTVMQLNKLEKSL